MQIFKDLSADYDEHKKVVVLGNFDGVHKGHQAVISRAQSLAQKLKAKTVVVTFEPHPRHYFQPDHPPFRLTPKKVKRLLMEELGVDAIFELDFNDHLAHMEAIDFVENILIDKLNIAAVVTGYDFHFGKNRQGTPQMMEKMAQQFGFSYICVDALKDRSGKLWSASYVRDALEKGDVQGAESILGRPFMFEGDVIHGRALGRTIGFPTANILPLEYIRPMRGVYAVKAKIDGENIWRDAIANIGVRPTVSGDHTLIEVHLLDWEGDLYGKILQVALFAFLRPEKKFDNINFLKNQIKEDVGQTKKILSTFKVGSLVKINRKIIG